MPDQDNDQTTGKLISKADEDLLKQIREDYKYCVDYWRENREEAATDMRYVANQPWTQDETNDREGRPCLTPDELSQYLKQANNNYRQNKVSIKVTPKGLGATDDDAQKRQDAIRGIEYKSNAQAAYTSGFEQATEGGMGVWRITTESVPTGDGFDVEPRIKRIANPFTVLFDPNAKEADLSDGKICFVTDVLRKSEFKRRYPKAVKTSFTPEDSTMASDWIKGENILVAEYWCVEETSRRKLQVQGEAGPTMVYEDELKDGDEPEILNDRSITERKVTQYITNGVEILEKNEWPGSWIPIIAVVGEEIYTNEGGKSKRIIMSLVRRARSAQKMLCYIASQEQEEFGMSPRSPFFIWEGQETADQEALKALNKVPRAYIKLKPTTGPDGQMLPGPTRIPFIPNAQAYEIAREAWRRAIQAAMGITPLPTAAQRQNEKSGVALQHIATQEAVGTFHFTDNHNRAVENTGRQLNELITKIIDTPRQLSARKADDTHSLLAVSTMKHGAPQGVDESEVLFTDKGEFDVTMSTGPNFQSQRQEASDFVDTLVGNLKALPIPQPIAQEILSKAIRLKNVGPEGDAIADLLSPPDPNKLPPAVQAMAAQAQGQIQELQQELRKLQQEKEGKVVQGQFSLQEAQMNNEVKLAIAEIGTKAQVQSERMEMVLDLLTKLHIEHHSAAHETALQTQDQAHQKEMAQQAAQQAAATQMSDQQHQTSMAEATQAAS